MLLELVLLWHYVLKECLICMQMFGLLSSGFNIKASSVEQEAASAVASVDTYT